MTRYQHLANLLAERIEQGLYRHGEKLPSVRSLSQEHGVSISTITADHAAAAFRLFCCTTKSTAAGAADVAPGPASS